MKNSLITVLFAILISLTLSCGIQKGGSTSSTNNKDETTKDKTTKKGIYFKSGIIITSFTINPTSGSSLYGFEDFNYTGNADFTLAYPYAFQGCAGTELGIVCYNAFQGINVSGQKICDADMKADNSNLTIECHDDSFQDISDNCIEIK